MILTLSKIKQTKSAKLSRKQQKNPFLWAKLFGSGRGPGWTEKGIRIFLTKCIHFITPEMSDNPAPRGIFSGSSESKTNNPKNPTKKVAAAWVVTNPFSLSLLRSQTLSLSHTPTFLSSHHLEDQEILLLVWSNRIYPISTGHFFVWFKSSDQMSTKSISTGSK